MILFNNLPGMNLVLGPISHTFEKREGRGCNEFISYNELVDKKNGYIKDDKIVLGVELMAEQVVRMG